MLIDGKSVEMDTQYFVVTEITRLKKIFCIQMQLSTYDVTMAAYSIYQRSGSVCSESG